MHLLDVWIRQNPSPASRNIQALWRDGSAQERIASVASVELLHWDGGLDAPDAQGVQISGQALLIGLFRRFPRPQLELSFIADMHASPPPRELVVSSAYGSPMLELVPLLARGFVREAWARSIRDRLSRAC